MIFCNTAPTPGLSPVTVEETGVRPDRPGCLYRALTFKNMASLDIAEVLKLEGKMLNPAWR